MIFRNERNRNTGTAVVAPRRGSVRTLGLVLTAALLVAFLTPLIGGGGSRGAFAAPSQPSEPTTASLQDGGTGNGGFGDTPVIQETPVAEETPVGDEAPVTEETPVDGQTPDEGIAGLQSDPYAGRIIVFMRNCDYPYENGFQQLDANCTNFDGQRFDVYGVDNAGKGLDRTGTSYLDLDSLGGGRYTIRSATPADYRSPTVFCSRGAYDGEQGTYDPVVTVVGYYEFDLAPGERIACHWFYIPTVVADPYAGRIVVFVRDCADPFDNDFQKLDANCTGFEGQEFEVYGVDNAGKGLQQTGTSYLDVSGIGGGQYTIRSFTPDDYRSPSVFCSRGAYGSPQGSYDPTATVDGYYEFDLAPGERIACHWFYVPKVIGYGTLKVGVSVCPPVEEIPIPFDYATASVFDLANVCSIYRDGRVQFLLYAHANGQNTYESTDPNNYAIAYWSAMPAGGQTLSTESWPGYGTARLACSDDQANVYEVGVQDWAAELELRKDVTTICDWWIIPGTEQPVVLGGAVSIVRYTCDGIAGEIDPYSAGQKLLLEQCQPGGDARNNFNLFTAASGGAPEAVDGVGGDGSITWRDVPTGELTVTGVDGDGYGDPVAFCSAYNSSLLVFESVYEKVRVVDDSFEYRLDENYSLNCDWFAIPASAGGQVINGGNGDDPNAEENEDTGAGSGSVTVVAYACPEGAGAQGGFEGYQAACTAVTEGAVFKLDGTSSGNPGEMTTDADGAVTWANREADHYYFYRQEVPEGYTTPAVFCGISTSRDEEVAAFAQYTVGDGWRIDFDLAEGESIVCAWFDFAGDAASEDADPGVADQGVNDGTDDAPTSSGETTTIVIYDSSLTTTTTVDVGAVPGSVEATRTT